MLIIDDHNDELSMLKKKLTQTFDMKNSDIESILLACVLSVRGIMLYLFICICLSIYTNYSRGLIWKQKDL